MNYNGIACTYCGKNFEQTDDIVVCPICGTPHHRDCWNENGRCVNAEKHIEGYIWQSPAPSYQPATPEIRNDRKVCPVCGQENEKFEPVCTRCGERLKNFNQTPLINTQPQHEKWNQAPEYQYNHYQNVHAQDARMVYGDNTDIDGIPVTEMAEYIQKDSNKYIGKFLIMKDKNTKFSWNWSAALAGVHWCFYRKMMGLGIAIMAIIFSVNLASSTLTAVAYEKMKPEVYSEYEDAAEELLASSEKGASMEFYEAYMAYVTSPITVTTNIITLSMSLILSVVMGFLGNYFYKKKIVKDINSIRRVATDNTVYHIYLKQKGGSSIVNLLMPFLINSILNMLTAFI